MAQQSFPAAHGLTVSVKEIAPTDLQIVCIFKHRSGGNTMTSFIAALDQALGGQITTLRNQWTARGVSLRRSV